MTRVVVTGANGFVGSQLMPLLKDRGYDAVGVTRAQVGEIGPETAWSPYLTGVDCVVHLAARVHVMNDSVTDPLNEYRRVNVEGTRRLAHEAVQMGVKRLIYLSSIKVMGEETDEPYTEDSQPTPVDPYGVSKWEAEQMLLQLARQTGLEVVILRPPLVYGPGVKANFLALIRAVVKGLPLPLGSIENSRSLIFLGNLVDAIRVSVDSKAAVNRTFLVSDSLGVSTPELIRSIALAAGKRARLISVPVNILKLVGKLTGRTSSVSRLVGSLQVSNAQICRTLGWQPPYTFETGLKETLTWYKNSHSV